MSTASAGGGGGMLMRIPANSEWVRVIRLTVAGVTSRMGFSYDDVEDIKLAVSEACNNAILHASPKLSQDTSANVLVELIPHADRIEIVIEDEGQVEPPGLPDIRSRVPFDSASTGELPEGGLGLLLIRSLMDEVEHSSGPDSRTAVRMVKFVADNAHGSQSN